MTGMCGAAYLGTEWELVLAFSDHPAAARHPSNGGELGALLYFFILTFHVFPLSLWDLTLLLCHPGA